MTFRQTCVKYIAVLGVILIILQVLVTSNYDFIKGIHSNATSTGIKMVGESYRKTYSIEQPDTPQVSTQAKNESSDQSSPVILQKTVKTINNGEQKAGTVGHEGHNGFELASSANNVCKTQHITSPGFMKSVHTIPEKRLLYCPMEKIGTTFWRRIFFMLVAKNPSKYKQPYDVSIGQALGQTRLFTRNTPNAKSVDLLTSSSFSFLFVRNPYSRLLSAFIDKLVPPNPTYWKAWGIKAISQYRSKDVVSKNSTSAGKQNRNPTIDGHDVTFSEFLQFVVATEKSGKNIDAHFMSINKACKPCANPYKYIGRMETFKDDALFIMKKLHMNETVEIMEESFSDYSTDDAITDSIRSPFGWKKAVETYISWDKALQRVWLKLQMRGIIESKLTLDLSNQNVHSISVNRFIDMARTAHKNSDPTELKKQKDMVKKEVFASVRLGDLKAFRDTFKDDFAMFGYDTSPSYIFDRGEEPKAPTKFFNYNHLN